MAEAHRDDSGRVNEYGWRKCPRCGKKVSSCGYGYRSHLRACLKREVVVSGNKYPPVDPAWIAEDGIRIRNERKEVSDD